MIPTPEEDDTLHEVEINTEFGVAVGHPDSLACGWPERCALAEYALTVPMPPGRYLVQPSDSGGFTWWTAPSVKRSAG